MKKFVHQFSKISKDIRHLLFTAIVLFFLTIIMFAVFLKHQEFVKAAPYDVIVSDIQANTVTISWKTTIDMPTYIRVLPDDSLLGNDELTTFHRVEISNLKELKNYDFLITDGERKWKRPYLSNSKELSPFVKHEYSFVTSAIPAKVSLPNVEEVLALPDELLFVSLYDKESNEYLGIKSYFANYFGGVAIDTTAFDPRLKNGEYEIKILEYFNRDNFKSALGNVHAYEVNCDIHVANQTIDGVTREQFANFATRWVNGRGKNHAYECFNDVVYSSKMAGVDPAFSLAIWLNESSASNYTQNARQYGYIEDFGIHGHPSVPAQDFKAQLNHFLSRSHTSYCEGLTKWEAWGNIYRYGTCNRNDPTQRQNGIDYYKRMASLYSWITNGKKLPDKVTGLPIPIDAGLDSGSWDPLSNPLCCAINYSDSENFYGEYIQDSRYDSCSRVWREGTELNEKVIRSSAEIVKKKGQECTVEYEGVCCKLSDDIAWYPKVACPYIIKDISNIKDCEVYGNEKACFYRNYFYQWLPLNIGEDSILDISTEDECNSRNTVESFNIELKKGINFVSFELTPSYNKDVLFASRLMNMYPEIELIAHFSNNEWRDLVKSSISTPYVGQDFFFEQEKGYLITAERDIVITLKGWNKQNESLSELSKGWNLVSGIKLTEDANTLELLSKVKQKIEDFSLLGVWSDESGSLVYTDREGSNNNIPFKRNQAVFIKR